MDARDRDGVTVTEVAAHPASGIIQEWSKSGLDKNLNNSRFWICLVYAAALLAGGIYFAYIGVSGLFMLPTAKGFMLMFTAAGGFLIYSGFQIFTLRPSAKSLAYAVVGSGLVLIIFSISALFALAMYLMPISGQESKKFSEDSGIYGIFLCSLLSTISARFVIRWLIDPDDTKSDQTS